MLTNKTDAILPNIRNYVCVIIIRTNNLKFGLILYIYIYILVLDMLTIGRVNINKMASNFSGDTTRSLVLDNTLTL